MATDDRDDRRTVMPTFTGGDESLDPIAVTNKLRCELEQVPYPSVTDRDICQEALGVLDVSDDPMEYTLLPKIFDFNSVGDWIRGMLLQI